MVFELNDPTRAAGLFAGWEETLIYSCLQGVMGKILVTDERSPMSACAVLGCFEFYAGVPEAALLRRQAAGFRILVPRDEAWAELIQRCIPNARRFTRYAIRKDTRFDISRLRAMTRLPAGYELRPIDGPLYDACLKSPETADFVSAFESKVRYLQWGCGMVVLKDGEIVSGASSFSRYRDGIEIEVDTLPAHRRKHLATAACAALILRCLDAGLYPSWDAHNMHSVRLAESLGYKLSHEYPAYEVG